MTVKKKISDGAAEESKERYEQCDIQVDILKVKEQEKYCMEFQKKAGTAMLFYEQADKYMHALELCNNVTYE